MLTGIHLIVLFISISISVDTYKNFRDAHKCDLEFENISIDIEHNLKKIFVSNHLLNKDTSLISLRIEDGFPIAILLESFLIFNIRCVHNMINKIRVPIESGCKWKLINGMSEGAFKSEGGLDPRYSDIFYDSNCAIYYPPRSGFDKSVKTKKIRIQLSVFPIVSDSQNGNPPSYDESGSPDTIGKVYINSQVIRNYLLEISLQRTGGFRNRNSYQVKLKCTSIRNDLENDTHQVEHIHVGPPSEYEENNFHSYLGSPLDKDDLNSTFDSEGESCILCDLKLYLSYWSWKCTEKLKIDLSHYRFFTSEYVRLKRRTLHEEVRSLEKCENNEKNVAIFGIKNKDGSTFTLSLSDCPFPKTFETIWNATAGSFPCGRLGNSVIFQSPEEKELRKSPITISTSKMIQTGKIFDTKTSCIEQRRIILLRKMVFGG